MMGRANDQILTAIYPGCRSYRRAAFLLFYLCDATMITLHIDGTEFTLQPDNAENVRALCASIKTKGKGRKFRPDNPRLNMTRRYPERATSTYDYVCQFEAMNHKIFGASEMKRWAPLNTRPTTHYDPTQPICVEEAIA